MAAKTDRLAAELPVKQVVSVLVLSWRNPRCRVQRDCVQDCFRNAHHFRSFTDLNENAALLLFSDGQTPDYLFTRACLGRVLGEN